MTLSSLEPIAVADVLSREPVGASWAGTRSGGPRVTATGIPPTSLDNGEQPGLRLPARPANLAGSAVAGWREPVVLSTYLPGAPERFPAYLDGRVYQGSSGRVYPLPLHTRIAEEPAPVEWDALHLENSWLRVMILPQLGGRVHVVRDRTRDFDLILATESIKPALVGLAGPWAAGGIEFNWPQHHRPTTFLPVDAELDVAEDGSVTWWCSEHDPFTRMKGMHGLRLWGDRAVLDVCVRLYNRSESTQSFLWWANLAARADDDYQSFFPDDVTQVADHARRAVTGFPAADREYYGIDYPARASRSGVAADGSPVPGNRLDWYRNIPVPTSYMAVGSRGNFFGGYDHRAGAGFVHVADPHVAVGKKQWTWGNADFGHAWDRQLFDDDTHYVELMAGIFTDNQPDFSHVAPGETKVFRQTMYALHDVGPVRAATERAAVAVEVVPALPGLVLAVGVVVTRPHAVVRVELTDGDGTVLDTLSGRGAPGHPVRGQLACSDARDATQLRIHVVGDGELLVRCGVQPMAAYSAPPGPAVEPPPPSEVASVEELGVIGAHLEQYRHATRSPEAYWREALRRDPDHVASCVGLAERAYRRRQFTDAEELVTRAVRRLTTQNAHPGDTGPLYLAALVVEAQGRLEEAYDLYGRAAWALAYRAAAGYRMARLDAARHRNLDALARLDDVLAVQPEHLQGLSLRVILCRRTGDHDRAEATVARLQSLDPLDAWSRDLADLSASEDPHTCLDVAMEYKGVGEAESALRLLTEAQERERTTVMGRPRLGPLIDYHRASVLRLPGRRGDAPSRTRAPNATAVRGAGDADATWCFPSTTADADVLEQALDEDPEDARAASLLGQWLYACGRRDEAVTLWRRGLESDARDVVMWRNLGLALAEHVGDVIQARKAYDRALDLGPRDPALIVERDRIDARLAADPRDRLQRLHAGGAGVMSRDDASVETAHLLITCGRLEDARALLSGRRFQPWEGGEGRVLEAWERLCLRVGSRALAAGNPEGALTAVDEAMHPPEQLGETRHPLASTAALALVRGEALALAGQPAAARASWRRAADAARDFRGMTVEDISEATPARITALRRLGEDDAATDLCRRLEAFCRELENDVGDRGIPDYFATSVPAIPLARPPAEARRHRAIVLRAHLAALTGEVDEARRLLKDLLSRDPAHANAHDLMADLTQT